MRLDPNFGSNGKSTCLDVGTTNFHYHKNHRLNNNNNYGNNNAYQIYLIGTMKINSLPEEEVQPTLNWLTDCPSCQQPFKDPVSLPCGYTLCFSCIPNNKFQCPSFTCLRVHDKINEKQVNITLQNLLLLHNNTTELLRCSVCLENFQDPITTECGHTFCKECLIQTMTQQRSHCPMCRFQLSRIGKVNQVIAGWTRSLYQQNETTETAIELPVLGLSNNATVPLNQDCLFRISHNDNNNNNLFRDMVENPYQARYAICISNHVPILFRVHHIECSSDLRYSVIQAYSLCVLDQENL